MDKFYPLFSAVAVLGVLGALFGSILALAAKLFSVVADPREDAIKELLPGVNCGGCGFAGCSAYAAAVVHDAAPTNKCAPGGSDTAASIANIMGSAPADSVPKYAFVHCSGGDRASRKYIYSGLDDCVSAANSLSGGPVACSYGCLGLGSCSNACLFDAISISNGVAVVDPLKCTGCGACVNACPKSLIQLLPHDAVVSVACSNRDKGAAVRKICEAACLGCKICEKHCPNDAAHVSDNLASIDSDKCLNCGVCVAKCPRHSIILR